jgi:hypothetical protein
MKKFGKILGLCIVISLLAVSPVFSQSPSLQGLQDAVDSFSESMAKSLPFNSTIGLNWSDAYIGQLLSAPPRFGIGTTFGVTTVSMGFVNDLLGEFGDSEISMDIPDWLGLPLPAYTVDVRIGGFILPFDIGLKFGYLDTSNMDFMDELLPFELNYLLIGGDVRYSLIDRRIIKLSAGLGFNHLSGGISITGPSQSFSFGPSNDTISITDPSIGLQWRTNNLELKAHASFVHFIVTPYVGAGLGVAWSRAGYHITSNITVNGGPIDPYIDTLKAYGITDINPDGFESLQTVTSFNMRAYGGVSFNMAVIRLDITAMYNIIGNNLGASIGLRFQL